MTRTAATTSLYPAPVSAWRVFMALFMRDVTVVRREMHVFLLRTSLQPIMLTIVFGYLLPKMGFVQHGYTAALLPGVLGISMAFAALQAVALPMVTDFGWTREIEDRLLAPVDIHMVAIEKVVAGTIQGVIAALFVLPVARLIMGPIQSLSIAHFGIVMLIALLGSLSFSTFGLLLGTAIDAEHIGLMFGFIVAPMIFFGCTYYPWKGLDVVPVMKYAVLVNPLVYVAEGLRASLTPGLPHMSVPFVLLALVIVSGLFLAIGMKTFERRAIG